MGNSVLLSILHLVVKDGKEAVFVGKDNSVFLNPLTFHQLDERRRCICLIPESLIVVEWKRIRRRTFSYSEVMAAFRYDELIDIHNYVSSLSIRRLSGVH